MTSTSTPAVDLDPFSVPGQLAMNDVLRRARRDEPVFHSNVLQAWVVTRAADVAAALADPRVFSSIGALPEPSAPEVLARLGDRVPAGATLIGWDAPEHTRMRQVLQAAFTAPGIRALEPLYRARVARLLDGLADRDRVDVLTEVALPVTLDAVFDLIGIPTELREQCFAWSTDWGRLHGADAEGLLVEDQLRLADSAVALHDLVADLIVARRSEPSDDLISQVLRAEAEKDEEQLTATELLSLFPGLIFAGHENSAHLAVNALARLLPRDDRLGIAADPRRLGRLVEETARLDPPFAGAVRTVTTATTLGGHRLRAGDRVFLHYASANRDDTAFPDPDRMDLDRARSRNHFAFGHGAHACIGAALGRMEATVLCELILDRWPQAVIAETPLPAPHYFMRGYQRLVVKTGLGQEASSPAMP